MKKVIEFLKNHYGKIFAGTTGTLIFTVGGFFFSDARYVHNKDNTEQHRIIQMKIVALESRIHELEEHSNLKRDGK